MHFQCISCFFSPGQWRRDDSTAAEHHHFLCADWSETRGGVHREPGGPPRPGSKPACQSHRHHMYVLSTKHNFMLGFSGIYYSKHNTLQSQSTKMLNLNYIWRRPPPEPPNPQPTYTAWTAVIDPIQISPTTIPTDVCSQNTINFLSSLCSFCGP